MTLQDELGALFVREKKLTTHEQWFLPPVREHHVPLRVDPLGCKEMRGRSLAR
ncbi:hypothetical protein PMJ10TS2_14840 [Paenibacillus melissococcoides]